MKALKVILGIVLLLVLTGLIAWFGFLRPEPPSISDADRAKIVLMPLPSEMEIKEGFFVLDNDFGHTYRGPGSQKIERALDRFHTRLNTITGIPGERKKGSALQIDCKVAGSAYPNLDSDESYSLKITSSGIRLSAPTEIGIFHGLESLLQLVEQHTGGWAFAHMELTDRPRYPWRGIMIDAARHWIPKEVILRNLDAMAAVKMNVLHLHLTEYQGFRIESKKFPKLHEMGSNGKYYSQEDIQEIINYAADRGIRIVPEFDVPGHSTSWFVGHPELASAPGPYVLDSVFGILDPVMDPSKEETYAFLDEFFGEMAQLFPDEYLHIGGDEVKTKQWEENSEISKFMEENDIGDYHELQAHFNIRLQKILETHEKKMMGWDEIAHPQLPKEGIVVQSWRSQKSLWDAAKAGNKAVLSTSYYLDHKLSAGSHYKVDPLVIPSAVTIDVDSTNWKAWDSKMYVQGTEMEGALYLFGEGETLRGIMTFMDNATSFTEAHLEAGRLKFTLETAFGKVDHDLTMSGDSLNGTASLAIISIDFKGKRIGGSDMAEGITLPKFEKIEPLTEAQEKLILGGEACMWTEMVGDRTIESRIWPRAAAIAEKLWSPKPLTTNGDDMYRRLMVLDKNLETMGIQHIANREALLKEMVPPSYLEPLQELVAVLQEDKFFNRMTLYDPQLYTSTPLNRIVDAAPAESYVGYRFNKDVDLFLEAADPDAKRRIEAQLEAWSQNHDKLLPLFGTVENFMEDEERTLPVSLSAYAEKVKLLREIEPHSLNFSELSELALQVLTSSPKTAGEQQQLDSLISKAGEAQGGTLLSVADGLSKLIEIEHQNLE